MKKKFHLAIASILLILSIYMPSKASEFQYPYYLIDMHNPTSECWNGINESGGFPMISDPNYFLVGPPPNIESSAISLPIDSWVELLFRGEIVDGDGNDVLISEIDAVGEKALIFLTDGVENEYLLGLAEVPNTNRDGPTIIGYDIAGLALPFEPCAVRVVGTDLRGGSPGFDLSYVSARISRENSEISTYPYPPDKITNVPIDINLNWIGGSYSNHYNVYFSTDISDVYPDAAPIQYPSQPQDSNSFDPGMLQLNKTYYWRIDQVNDTEPDIFYSGKPWSFSTEKYLVFDDFESYTGYTLGDTWYFEGYGTTWLVIGSEISHSCSKAMAIDYRYTQGVYSKVLHYFDEPQDWSTIGVKSLELYFSGDMNNGTTCQMYLSLGDGTTDVNIPYNKDMNDISQENWQVWRIDLQDITGIDLSSIEYFAIGFKQDPNQPESYGNGTVYFDDIRLNSFRCFQGDGLEADFNNDCIVNFEDYTELAYNWLETGFNIYQVQEPNDAPVFWYEFEDNVLDTTGNAHGEIVGFPSFVEGVYGKAIKLDGYLDWIDVTSVESIFSQITEGITIAFWQNADDSPYKRDTVFCSEYIYNISDPVISINLGCWKDMGIYNWDCGSEFPFDRRLTGKHRYKQEWAGRWNHWAFTKDANTGIMQVFLNGRLINNKMDSSQYISLIDSFTIGTGWYGGYDGLLDDFRIYDYALTQPEIAYVATNGTGIFDQTLMTNADIYNDNIIDFKDIMIFAENWLKKDNTP